MAAGSVVGAALGGLPLRSRAHNVAPHCVRRRVGMVSDQDDAPSPPLGRLDYRE
jgi:hypothetical protein